MQTVHIEQIRQELTWKLRREVLYPHAGTQEMSMPEDDEGTHFGAFVNGWIVGVVSLFNKGDDYQFRKFAVSADVQGRGIGGTLLEYITQHTISFGGKRLWCNARNTAAGFYERYGFTSTGQVFERHGFNYIIMEKWLAETARQ